MTAYLDLRRSSRAPVALVLFGASSVGASLEGGMFAVLLPLRKGTRLRTPDGIYILPVTVKRGLYWRPLRLEQAT